MSTQASHFLASASTAAQTVRQAVINTGKATSKVAAGFATNVDKKITAAVKNAEHFTIGITYWTVENSRISKTWGNRVFLLVIDTKNKEAWDSPRSIPARIYNIAIMTLIAGCLGFPSAVILAVDAIKQRSSRGQAEAVKNKHAVKTTPEVPTMAHVSRLQGSIHSIRVDMERLEHHMGGLAKSVEAFRLHHRNIQESSTTTIQGLQQQLKNQEAAIAELSQKQKETDALREQLAKQTSEITQLNQKLEETTGQMTSPATISSLRKELARITEKESTKEQWTQYYQGKLDTITAQVSALGSLQSIVHNLEQEINQLRAFKRQLEASSEETINEQTLNSQVSLVVQKHPSETSAARAPSDGGDPSSEVESSEGEESSVSSQEESPEDRSNLLNPQEMHQEASTSIPLNVDDQASASSSSSTEQRTDDDLSTKP